MGHFWTIPSHERCTSKLKKGHHQVFYVWPACRTPKRPVLHISMAAIYDLWKMSKIGQHSMKKWPLNGKSEVWKKFSIHIYLWNLTKNCNKIFPKEPIKYYKVDFFRQVGIHNFAKLFLAEWFSLKGLGENPPKDKYFGPKSLIWALFWTIL